MEDILLDENIDFVESQIGYEFETRDLLVQAFTRKSYSSENGGDNNEKLEWIGDSVLYMYVTKIIIDEFGHFKSDNEDFDSEEDYDEFYTTKYKTEGRLSKLRDQFINKKTLASKISDLGLQNYLLMGQGDINKNLQEEDSVKEDLFEAIIGAVALDCNFDGDCIQEVLEDMLDITNELKGSNTDVFDYVMEFQKWYQKNIGDVPYYEYEESDDPDYNFTAYLYFDYAGESYEFSGDGYNKIDAKKTAAEQAYNYLEENDMLWTVYDEIPDDLDLPNAINVLQELYQKGYLGAEPVYEIYDEPEFNDDGSERWTCSAELQDGSLSTSWSSPSKKESKKLCAYDMLCQFLNWENKYDK